MLVSEVFEVTPAFFFGDAVSPCRSRSTIYGLEPIEMLGNGSGLTLLSSFLSGKVLLKTICYVVVVAEEGVLTP